jgi:hypothetical protein
MFYYTTFYAVYIFYQYLYFKYLCLFHNVKEFDKLSATAHLRDIVSAKSS